MSTLLLGPLSGTVASPVDAFDLYGCCGTNDDIPLFLQT